MELSFAILALILLASAAAAVSLRHLVHGALCLIVTFVSLAALYLQLGAEFVGFAQILVYAGAVAILILFAILLTRSAELRPKSAGWSPGWRLGLAVALAAFVSLALAIRSSRILPDAPAASPEITVRMIGAQLLHRPGGEPEDYILPMLVTGVLLTAALMGAVLIAMPGNKDE
jgi:NADH-quinone oxidoreductase subunit J